MHFDVQQCFTLGNKATSNTTEPFSPGSQHGLTEVEVTKNPLSVGCIIWPGGSVWPPVKLLKIEQSLQVNSVKYLLALRVGSCSVVRVFLPRKCKMFFMWLYPFLRPISFFFLTPMIHFPLWLNASACNFLSKLNSITPYACLVFGSYSPAQKLQLNYGVDVVAVFTHSITRCSTTAVGKVIASSGPAHLSTQNLGFYFHD